MTATPDRPRSPGAGEPTKPAIITEQVQCCSVTGEVACMDCIEGRCSGSDEECYTEVHTCTGCGGHDAWGEMHHAADCPHYVEREVPL